MADNDFRAMRHLDCRPVFPPGFLTPGTTTNYARLRAAGPFWPKRDIPAFPVRQRFSSMSSGGCRSGRLLITLCRRPPTPDAAQTSAICASGSRAGRPLAGALHGTSGRAVAERVRGPPARAATVKERNTTPSSASRFLTPSSDLRVSRRWSAPRTIPALTRGPSAHSFVVEDRGPYFSSNWQDPALDRRSC